MTRPAASADPRDGRPPAATPALSVVVVTPTTFAQVRRTVAHLRRQSVVDRIELVLVTPDERSVHDADPAETAPFAAVRVVPVGPIDNVDPPWYRHPSLPSQYRQPSPPGERVWLDPESYFAIL